jgi:hypothetical protein
VRPVGAKLALEVRRFTASPGSPDVAVLELEGIFRSPARRRIGAPRLLAENAEERVEIGAADAGDAIADPDGALWRASFAIPLRVLAGAEYALAVGRELLDLPAPDRDEGANGASDLHVRLAREANALRALADEAREAAAAALGRADTERGQRERLEAEMRGERHAREELATRLAQFESELTARDEAMERLRAEHAEELARRDAETEAKVDERVVAAEAEMAELRRALKSARADIELLRRERDRAAGRTAVLRAEPATTRMAVEPSVHPEQDAASPALPLPEGEDVGPARPASGVPATNGTGRHAHADDDHDDDDQDHDRGDDHVPPPTTVAGGRVGPHPGRDRDDDPTETQDADDATWSDDDEAEGVRVLGRRPNRTRSGDEPPVEPLPGTAAIGARHIVAGDMGPSRLGPWIARGMAVLALAFVVAAVLLVVWGMR